MDDNMNIFSIDLKIDIKENFILFKLFLCCQVSQI